jgi:acid phosphatase (class A)
MLITSIPGFMDLRVQQEINSQGYLGEALPNPLLILPPPPEEDGPEWEFDQEMAEYYMEADEDRKSQAVKDAILRFPLALDAFNIILESVISETNTPALYRILWKTKSDGAWATFSAKRFYRRARPFLLNKLPTLIPWEEDLLSQDGSYPSGHTAIGWIWALILTELFPRKAEEILERGRQFGISRNICNVHWYSDVVSGRLCGAAVVQKLYAHEGFLADLEEARKECQRINGEKAH